MTTNRFVVMGLANVRSVWFREVGRWATAAAIPVDFVKCVSVEEVRARLDSGRSFSALLVDASVPGVDRDVIDAARLAGTAVLVVHDGRTRRDWHSLGATSVLAEAFERAELLEELERHARPLDAATAHPNPAARTPTVASDWSGTLVAVTGGPGAGSSTIAMATAQGLGADPRNHDLTLLADLCLDASLAMLHDARDVIPGLQEMVEAHRVGSPSLAEVRNMVFDASARGYHLLLGLRRHRDWSVLRPRAVATTLEALLRSYRVVVADIDPDVEGEDETGSIDVEERNLLARTVARRADLVLVVGTPTMKGLNDLLRVVNDLVSLGVAPARILPVLNRSSRPGRGRAEASAALGELLAPISTGLASPIHVPTRRSMEEMVRDNLPLPGAFCRPLARAVTGMLEVIGPQPRPGFPEPVTVAPGSLGRMGDPLEDA